MMTKNTELIVALDFQDLHSAQEMVKILKPEVKIFKIGSQLFTSAGPKAIEMVKNEGGEIFLDLKFYDIPNTVAQAVKAAAQLGVTFINMHIEAGKTAIVYAKQALLENFQKTKRQTYLLGVTVLTSVAQEEILENSLSSSEIKTSSASAFQLDIQKLIWQRAKKGLEAGLDGLIASAQEAPFLRKEFGPNFILICPGIRPSGTASDDQKRIATPAEAAKAGCDYIVVGRPITKAANPIQVTKQIKEELKQFYES